jgi:hypothetical protein
MEFILYFAWYGLLAVVGIGAFILLLSVIGNMMAKNQKDEKSQSVLQKCGRDDIRIQK